MIKISDTIKNSRKIVKMRDMKPLQIGMINSHKINKDGYFGRIVMRCPSKNDFQVMDLSFPREGQCWTNPNDLMVELFNSGEIITIEISNDI